MDQELTVQQAADLLNVSRPYVIGLLETGVIDHTGRGEHRRVSRTSVLHHRRRDDRIRRDTADELSALTQGWA